MLDISLKLIQDSNVLEPLVENDIVWQLEKKGSAGKLTFTVREGDGVVVSNGDIVTLEVDGEKLFYGFVFEKQTSKTHMTTVIAYDQLHYLVKNKFSYKFEEKRTDEIIRMIAEDYHLNLDSALTNTGFPIPSRVYQNKTLLDIIQDSLNYTFDETGLEYIIYDNFGKLSLKSINDLKTDVLIDAESAEDFDYTDSIDRETYNDVILVKQNVTDESGMFSATDESNIDKWGLLRYFEEVTDDTETLATRAQQILRACNRPTKSLPISNAFGNVSVRGGSLITIDLTISGEQKLSEVLSVASVTHTFTTERHSMDLTVEGGDFVA